MRLANRQRWLVSQIMKWNVTPLKPFKVYNRVYEYDDFEVILYIYTP